MQRIIAGSLGADCANLGITLSNSTNAASPSNLPDNSGSFARGKNNCAVKSWYGLISLLPRWQFNWSETLNGTYCCIYSTDSFAPNNLPWLWVSMISFIMVWATWIEFRAAEMRFFHRYTDCILVMFVYRWDLHHFVIYFIHLFDILCK